MDINHGLCDHPAPMRAALIVILTIALATLVVAHVTGINGSAYHLWRWQRIEWWRVYPLMLAAAAPWAIALVQFHRARIGLAGAVALMMLSTFLLQLTVVGAQEDPFDLGRMARIVEQPLATSYFTDAQILAAQPAGALHEWLDHYPELMSSFWLHGRQKPPGPKLFCWIWIQLKGESSAALATGVSLAAISTLSVAATCLLAKKVTGQRDSAMLAAAWMAICPAMIVFVPTFDITYPILSCAMIATWLAAIERGGWRWPVAFGVALSVSLFFSFSLLVVGAVLVGASMLRPFKRALAAASIALAVVVVIYGLLWLRTGYDPIATFRSALTNQRALEASFRIPRPYPQTIPSDIQDFLLGSGWISLAVVIMWGLSEWKSSAGSGGRREILVGLGAIGIVAATGLLACETSRVWLFLQPLVMIPLGQELSRWSVRARAIALACLLLLTCVIAANMQFLTT